MITVIIRYSGNKVGFSQLLVSLQPQLHPDDDIYVVDSTPDRSSLPLVKMYGSTRCYIFVEPSTLTGRDAIRLGLQSMKENKQKGALVISDRCVISTTFIASLKRAATHDEWSVLVPRVIFSVEGELDKNFSWFCPMTTTVVKVGKDDKELYDAATYIKERAVNADFTLDFHEHMEKVGRFSNELVVIF